MQNARVQTVIWAFYDEGAAVQGEEGVEVKFFFFEVIVSVIVRKKLIWVWFGMVTEMEVFESPDLTPLDFCLWGWMKNEVHKRKVDIRDKLLAHILDAAAHIGKGEDHLRRIARDLRTQVVKCTEVDDGIVEHLIVKCNKYDISV